MVEIKKTMKVKIKGEIHVCVEKKTQGSGIINFLKKSNRHTVATLDGGAAGKDFYLCLLESKDKNDKSVMSIFVGTEPIGTGVIDEFELEQVCFGPCPDFLIRCPANTTPQCNEKETTLACGSV